MFLALFLASGSALLGGALALLVQKRRVLLGLTRTFAFAAAAGVVLMHLLPEALDAIGVRGLLWAAFGFAIPGLLEWRASSLGSNLRARGLSPARVAAEVGFLALTVHSLLEGVALSAAASGSGSHLDLEIALVAHHAPLTAAVILPFLDLISPRGVALRVLAIAAAGGLGALFGIFAPAGLTEQMPQNIASAVMAGALLHVVADEICLESFGALWERAADLSAAAIGVGIAVVSAIFGGSSGGPFELAFALFLPVAPALLAADLLAAIPRNRRRRSAPLPELEGLLVSLRALGFVAALVQLALGFAGWLVSSAFAPGEGRPPEIAPRYFDRVLAETALRAPRRLLAFLLGSIALSLIPYQLDIPQLVAAAGLGISFLLLSALSCGAAAAVAAGLIARLLPWAPGAALLVPAIALGPLLARRSSLRGGLRKRAIGALLTLLFGAVAAAILVNTSFDQLVQSRAIAMPLVLFAQRLSLTARLAPAESVAAAILLLLALFTLWRSGARGWFAQLRPGSERPSDLADQPPHTIV